MNQARHNIVPVYNGPAACEAFVPVRSKLILPSRRDRDDGSTTLLQMPIPPEERHHPVK